MARRLDRESGIGEDPGDETLAAIDIGNETLAEELRQEEEDDNSDISQDANSSGDDSEDSFRSADLPAMAGVGAQQLATIPVYDGERGESLINWIELVDNAIQTYGWDHTGGLHVLKVKGGSKVSEWLRSQRLQNIIYNAWTRRAGNDGNADVPVREELIARFGPRYTPASAVTAISTLKQRDSESVADFMDRVVLATDRMFNNLPAATRASAEFRETMTRTTLSLFGAGMKPEISKIVLAQATAPATIPEMITAAEAVEIEQAKKPTAAHPSVYAVSEEPQPPAPSDSDQEIDDLEILREDFNELCCAVSRQVDLSKIRCYNCQRFGHFASSCLAPRRQRRGGFGGRRGNRGRRPTRNEERRRPFGPSRATMAVQPNHEDNDQDSDYDGYGYYETPLQHQFTAPVQGNF